MIKNIIIAGYHIIAITLIIILLMEFTGQIIYYKKNGHTLMEFNGYNRVFELHPYLAGRMKSSIEAKDKSSGKVISSTTNHTRWTGAGKEIDDKTRVAVLGGSTTFGTGVTDKDSWTAILQNMLGGEYAVINYGVPGYSTAEAIIQMGLIVPEIRPNIVIYYEGWNDIRNYHDDNIGEDYFNHGMKQYGNLGIPSQRSTPKSGLEKLSEVSVIMNEVRKLAIKTFPKDKPKSSKDKVRSDPDPFIDRIYLRNLKTLKMLAENINADAIFVPQILNYSSFVKDGISRGWSPYIEDSAMPRLLDRFNLILNDACQVSETECVVVNEVKNEAWSPEDFVDDGHFNKIGGKKFASLLANVILSRRGLTNDAPKDLDNSFQ